MNVVLLTRVILPDSARGLQLLENDLEEARNVAWYDDGLAEIEKFLGKHAAFQTFLEEQDALPKIVPVNEEPTV